MKLNWRNIRSAEDIITYAREHNSDILNEDRMSEHSSELFKGFIKSDGKIIFKLREFDEQENRIVHKCVFKICTMLPDGKTTITGTYNNKKELRDSFDKLKTE